MTWDQPPPPRPSGPSPPSESPGGSPIKKAISRAIYVLVGLAALVVLVGLIRGDPLVVHIPNAGSVSLTGGQQGSTAASTTIASETLEQQLERSEEAFAENEQLSASSFDGRWNGPAGLTYLISDFGVSATIREESAVGGVTAAGEGFIDGDTFFFTFTNAFNVQGEGQLTMSGSGQRLSGFFTDGFNTVELDLTR